MPNSIATPWTVARHAPQSMGFPRQEYWSGLPFSSPWDRTWVSCIGRKIPYHWATWEALSSVQFSLSVMSNSLQPHELQHARPPCPSPTPGVHSSSELIEFIIESVMPYSHLILYCPLLLLPSIFPSIRVFSNEIGRAHV